MKRRSKREVNKTVTHLSIPLLLKVFALFLT